MKTQKDAASLGSFHVSWRVTAISFGLVSLTLVVVLAVVASLKQVEALATIALALAVISFAIQIVLFVLESAANRQNTLEAQQLHSRTQTLLAEIGERTRGTEKQVDTISEKLLTVIIGKSVAETEAIQGADAEGSDLATRAAVRVAAVVRSESSQGQEYYPRRLPDSQDDQIVNHLRTFPQGKSLGRAIEVLASQLDVHDRQFLMSLARDEIRIRQEHSEFALGIAAPPTARLSVKKLVERGDSLPYGEQLVRLTDEGRQIARVLTARGRPPKRIESELRTWREEATSE
jgi:heme/copper-type cytochrome/quinol oxidase subunit 4